MEEQLGDVHIVILSTGSWLLQGRRVSWQVEANNKGKWKLYEKEGGCNLKIVTSVNKLLVKPIGWKLTLKLTKHFDFE